MDGDSIGCSLIGFFVLVVIIAVFAWLSPAMNGPNGSVVTVQEPETVTRDGVTQDGNVTVVVLSSLASGIALLATMLCSGGLAFWICAAVVTVLGLVALAAK